MQLLFVSRRYWPAVGGVESFLRHVARGLGERHAVTVLTHRIDDGPTGRLTDSLRPPPSFDPFFDGPVRVVPLRISLSRRALMAPLVTQVIPGLRRYAYGQIRIAAASLYALVVAPEITRYGQGADVVHMWGGDLLAAAAMRAARLVGVPGVITPFAHANQYGVGPADVFAYRGAERVVALLETDAAVYRRLGISEECLDVCGVGTPGVQAGHGGDIRRRFDIDGPLVLFLGVRRPYKGFDLLLEAAPLVGAAIPDVTFAFVGPGARLPNVVGVRIVDAGFVDGRECAGWLEAADLLCLPSEAEIFPLSILEAWSVGTPVVASDLPTLVELLGKADGGITAAREPRSLADAILGLLESPARGRAMGTAGQAFWRGGFTAGAVTRRHERLYGSLIGMEVAECAA